MEKIKLGEKIEITSEEGIVKDFNVLNKKLNKNGSNKKRKRS